MKFIRAERAFIVLGTDSAFDFAASRDRRGDPVPEARFAISRSVLAEVLRTARPVLTSDARAVSNSSVVHLSSWRDDCGRRYCASAGANPVVRASELGRNSPCAVLIPGSCAKAKPTIAKIITAAMIPRAIACQARQSPDPQSQTLTAARSGFVT
jgi:hypothetical protein